MRVTADEFFAQVQDDRDNFARHSPAVQKFLLREAKAVRETNQRAAKPRRVTA